MVTLAVGTDAGFFLLEESAGTWTIKAQCLDGVEVLGLAKEPDGNILAASRGAGLNRIDSRTGALERIGGGALPAMLHAVTISPHNPRCIYVGTEPAGIYASHDGGAHFEVVPFVAQLNVDRHWTYPIPTIGTHIRDIVVDADDPDRLYAAVQVGGLIRSEDAGRSWAVVDDALDPDVHAILQHPVRHELIYAVCGGGGGDSGDPAHRSGRPIYRSVDRGNTWECVSHGFTRTYGAPIGIVPGPRPVLLAGVARGIPPSWRKRPERADAAVVVSEDDGQTWQSATESLGSQAKMFEAIAVASSDRNRVFIGTGIDVAAPQSDAQRTGEILHAPNLHGPWTQLPLALPGIAAMTCI